MGLIDGLGDLREVMRDLYGEDVRLRVVDERLPWWKRRFGMSFGERGEDWRHNLAGSLITAVEERMIWNRFGL